MAGSSWAWCFSPSQWRPQLRPRAFSPAPSRNISSFRLKRLHYPHPRDLKLPTGADGTVLLWIPNIGHIQKSILKNSKSSSLCASCSFHEEGGPCEINDTRKSCNSIVSPKHEKYAECLLRLLPLLVIKIGGLKILYSLLKRVLALPQHTSHIFGRGSVPFACVSNSVSKPTPLHLDVSLPSFDDIRWMSSRFYYLFNIQLERNIGLRLGLLTKMVKCCHQIRSNVLTMIFCGLNSLKGSSMKDSDQIGFCKEDWKLRNQTCSHLEVLLLRSGIINQQTQGFLPHKTRKN